VRWLRRTIDRISESRAPDIARANLSFEQRMALFRQHGDFSLAYATVTQEGLAHFGDASGYIAYSFKMGSTIALGEPVIAEGDRAALADAFIGAAGDPCFAQIRRPFAERLAARGYRVALLGSDFVFDLGADVFAGGHQKSNRYSYTWLVRNGYRFGEWTGTEGEAEEAMALSQDWRATRIVARREMTFLNTPFSLVPPPDVRRFMLRNGEGLLVMMMDMQPMWRDGRPYGFTTALKRRRPDATKYAEVGLTKHIAETLAGEGLSRMTLGLAPLAVRGPSGFHESGLMRALLAQLAASKIVNERVFNLNGHAAFKRRLHACEEPVYFAWGRGSGLRHLVALMRLSKLI
jgi:lysylphosphatidylglycerol synthetase-like protein (DUF2156 family)